MILGPRETQVIEGRQKLEIATIGGETEIEETSGSMENSEAGNVSATENNSQ